MRDHVGPSNVQYNIYGESIDAVSSDLRASIYETTAATKMQQEYWLSNWNHKLEKKKKQPVNISATTIIPPAYLLL